MPGEKNTSTSAGATPNEMDNRKLGFANMTDLQGRLKKFKQVLLVLAVGAVIAIIFYLALYFQSGIWQTLLQVAFVAVALACAAVAFGLAHRKKFNAAGYWVFGGLVIAYGGTELVWAGATWYTLTGGILLTFLVGSIILPGKWHVWLITAAMFVVYVGLVNWFEPIPRYDISQSLALSVFIPGLTFLLAVVALWVLFLVYRRVDTIRTRLLGAFLFVVLLPAIVISAVSAISSFQSGQQQALNQLEILVSLKETEIDSWVKTLELRLENIALNREETREALSTLLQLGVFKGSSYEFLDGEIGLLIRQEKLFDEIFLLDNQGRVVYSTDDGRANQFDLKYDYFHKGLAGNYINPPFFDPVVDNWSVVVARPVTNLDGKIAGVFAGRTSLASLDNMVLGLDEQARSVYMVGSDGSYITGAASERVAKLNSEGIDSAVRQRLAGSGLYNDHRNVPVIGAYRWIPSLEIGLIAEEEQSEAFSTIYTALGINVGVALLSILLAVVAALFVTRGIATSVTDLAKTAGQIAAGDLNRVAKVQRQDEVGDLAVAFNSMTAQLRESIDTLEQHVADRTRRLEIVASLGERLIAILDLDELLVELVNQVKDNFGYYHVHIYLLDEQQQTLVVAAGIGQAGVEMKVSGHNISLNAPTSLVARAARTGEIVSVENVREAEDWLPNRLLPDTYSEMAVPIVLEDRVVGVLDVQSDKIAGLDEGDATLLRTLANQAAVAIRNARLFSEVETALAEAYIAQEQYVEQAWAETGHTARQGKYHYARANVPDLDESILVEARTLAQTQARPARVTLDGQGQDPTSKSQDPEPQAIVASIALRDKNIGSLQLHPASSDQAWTEDDLAVIEAVTDQLAQTAENLRLFDETRERAGREQTIREITDRLRAAPNLERLVAIASQELGERLGVTYTKLELGLEKEDQEVAS